MDDGRLKRERYNWKNCCFIRSPMKGRGKTSCFRLVTLLGLVACAAFYATFWKIEPEHKIKVKSGAGRLAFNNNTACSCWNATAPQHCCERTVLRAHKFGTILLQSLFGPTISNHATGRQQKKTTLLNLQQVSRYAMPFARLPTNRDYRHVLVTRNFVDAMISGYLYHRAGHECWLDNFGTPKGHNRTSTKWQHQLTFHDRQRQQQLLQGLDNRSLCLYLAQESEEDGMRVLMDVALSQWYRGVVPYWTLVQKHLQTSNEQHSLFVCFEDLVDPMKQKQVYHDMVHWLFPGQKDTALLMPPKAKAALEMQQHNRTVYSGGHSTIQVDDLTLRAKLQALVERLDDQFFQNTVEKSNAIFGCGVRS